MKIFIIFPFKNDFDLEYLTLFFFFFFYAKYTILYIFKIVPVSLEGQCIGNIHRILLRKIISWKRYRE